MSMTTTQSQSESMATQQKQKTIYSVGLMALLRHFSSLSFFCVSLCSLLFIFLCVCVWRSTSLFYSAIDVTEQKKKCNAWITFCALLHDPNAITVQFWLVPGSVLAAADSTHKCVCLAKTQHTNKLSPGFKIDLQFLFPLATGMQCRRTGVRILAHSTSLHVLSDYVHDNFIFHFRTLSMRSLYMASNSTKHHTAPHRTQSKATRKKWIHI